MCFTKNSINLYLHSWPMPVFIAGKCWYCLITPFPKSFNSVWINYHQLITEKETLLAKHVFYFKYTHAIQQFETWPRFTMPWLPLQTLKVPIANCCHHCKHVTNPLQTVTQLQTCNAPIANCWNIANCRHCMAWYFKSCKHHCAEYLAFIISRINHSHHLSGNILKPVSHHTNTDGMEECTIFLFEMSQVDARI